MNKFWILVALLASHFSLQAQKVLTLQDFRNLAIENNKELKISAENVEKANLDKKVAMTHYLPDIAFTGTYLRNQKNLSLLDADKFLPIGTKMADGSFGFTQDQVKGTTLPNGQWAPVDANGVPFDPKVNPEKIQWNEYTTIPKSEFEMDIKNVWAGNFSLIQPIFMGGKIVAYNQIAKYAKELALSMKDASLQDVILKTDEAYWQTVSLVNKKRLADSYVELLTKMNSDVTDLIQEGFATKADGLSVKVKLNEAEMLQTQVDNGLHLSRMLLCQLCGLELNEDIILADESENALPIKEESRYVDVNQALIDRPELKSLELATKIYSKKEAVVRSEMLPNIALTANYLITNPNLFNGFQNDFAGMWNVGVVVNVPLFHFGQRYNQLRSAKVETRIKKLELEDAKEKIELQVNQSVFKVNEAEKKLIAANKNMDSADENLRYANLGFEEGVIPVSNVMEAQSAWLKAHSELIDAQIEVKLSNVYLDKAIGKITTTNIE